MREFCPHAYVNTRNMTVHYAAFRPYAERSYVRPAICGLRSKYLTRLAGWWPMLRPTEKERLRLCKTCERRSQRGIQAALGGAPELSVGDTERS